VRNRYYLRIRKRILTGRIHQAEGTFRQRFSRRFFVDVLIWDILFVRRRSFLFKNFVCFAHECLERQAVVEGFAFALGGILIRLETAQSILILRTLSTIKRYFFPLLHRIRLPHSATNTFVVPCQQLIYLNCAQFQL